MDGIQVKVKRPRRRTPDMIRNFVDRKVMPHFLKEARKLAFQMRDDLVDRIKMQSFDHPELTLKYKKRKLRWRYDQRILIATRQYIKSFTVIPTALGASLGIDDSIGVKDIQHNPLFKTGKPIAMSTLSNFLEYGTKTMPPRPHWRPVIEEYNARYGTIKERMDNALQAAWDEAVSEEHQFGTVEETL